MTLEVVIGIILIAINVPFGWFGMLWLGYYGKKTGKKIFYFLSGLVYVLSWIMLSLGVFLCGKPYAKYIIDNYVVKYICPIVFILFFAAVIFLFIYRKKIFYSNGKNS